MFPFLDTAIQSCFPSNPIKKSNLITTVPHWGPTWKVSFKLTVHSPPPKDTYMSVFHFTTGENCCNVGDRIPALQVFNNQLIFLNAVDNNGNFVVHWHYEVEKTQSIEIKQTLNDDRQVSTKNYLQNVDDFFCRFITQ